jgi:glycosyltransferase A (GT-A) superfamily protein (DUF2064 family)
LLKIAQQNTAILIFANSSDIDEIYKGIPNSKALFSALTNTILKKVKKTELPYFIYDEELQIGADFGERFTTAIQSVFAKGFDTIITVGNDSPNLTVNTLLSAYTSLQQGKTVIGPSMDGGVYLLGLHKESFDAVNFRKLPWQQRNLFEKIAISFMQKGMVHELPRLLDIDAISDIQKIVTTGTLISSVLLLLLHKVLRSPKPKQEYYSNYKYAAYATNNFNKGSPNTV